MGEIKTNAGDESFLAYGRLCVRLCWRVETEESSLSSRTDETPDQAREKEKTKQKKRQQRTKKERKSESEKTRESEEAGVRSVIREEC